MWGDCCWQALAAGRLGGGALARPNPARPGRAPGVWGTAAAVGAFAAAGFVYPLYLWSRGGTGIDMGKPLKGEAGMRGVFLNTGSKDLGPDPDAAGRRNVPSIAKPGGGR